MNLASTVSAASLAADAAHTSEEGWLWTVGHGAADVGDREWEHFDGRRAAEETASLRHRQGRDEVRVFYARPEGVTAPAYAFAD